MTIQEMAALVGKTGTVFAGGFRVRVTVRDVKIAWGKTRYAVTPVEGSGEITVESIELDA